MRDSFEGIFQFDADDPIYQDHFPGNPIVPGSLIIAAFQQAIAEKDCNAKIQVIRNFRFKKFIIPGTYSYRIVVKENDFKCTLLREKQVVTTGILTA